MGRAWVIAEWAVLSQSGPSFPMTDDNIKSISYEFILFINVRQRQNRRTKRTKIGIVEASPLFPGPFNLDPLEWLLHSQNQLTRGRSQSSLRRI